LEGVVVMLQQVHHPPAVGDDEQMEIQLDPIRGAWCSILTCRGELSIVCT
jgi:hypothetical protein